MKTQKKPKSRKPATISSKKARSQRTAKSNGAPAEPLFDHRTVEHRFIAEHPEAFEPFIGEWIVLEGTSIVAHGQDAPVVADEARARGVAVPYIFRVPLKRESNTGYL
jgi:hypothetical protein